MRQTCRCTCGVWERGYLELGVVWCSDVWGHIGARNHLLLFSPTLECVILVHVMTHVVVLVHGLWGNPAHMANIEAELSKKSDIVTFLPKANAYNLTYDGLEVCASRLMTELEEFLKINKGIRKFSVVGYSLGGLIARFTIGMMLAKGWFPSRLEPVNFVTFATPHIGTRSPTRSIRNMVYDTLGGRTLSLTGQQLFLIDVHRNSQRPVLQVLASGESLYYRALALFPHRSLYANVVGEISVHFYTGAISPSDPFRRIGDLKVEYMEQEKYEQTIVDLAKTERQKGLVKPSSPPKNWRRIGFTVLIPLFLVVFLITSVVQTTRSQLRIRRHAPAEEYEDLDPLLSPVEEVEDMMDVDKHDPLDLSKNQLQMISSLNSLRWKKYGVHIHKTSHAHSAIISRSAGSSYSEGRIVIQHFVDNFQMTP